MKSDVWESLWSLRWYGGVWIATTCYALARQGFARRRVRKAAAAVAPPADAYETAAVTGGPQRAAQAAVVKLAASGVVLLAGAEGRELAAAGPLPEGAHPVERVVFDAITTAPPTRPMRAVELAAQHPRLREIAWKGAEAAGSNGGTLPAGTPPLAMLMVLGAVQSGWNQWRGLPFQGLACAVVAMALTQFWLHRRVRLPYSVRIALVQRLKAARPEFAPAAWNARLLSATPDERAMAVALQGLESLRGSPFSEYGPLMAPGGA